VKPLLLLIAASLSASTIQPDLSLLLVGPVTTIDAVITLGNIPAQFPQSTTVLNGQSTLEGVIEWPQQHSIVWGPIAPAVNAFGIPDWLFPSTVHVEPPLVTPPVAAIPPVPVMPPVLPAPGVPEPRTVWLFVIGFAMIGWLVRKERS